MDDAERVDHVVVAIDMFAQLFSVTKFEFSLQPVNLETLTREIEAGFRQFDASVVGPTTGEIDCCGSDTTADLKHALALPAIELRETRDMRLDKMLALFDLVEILTRADWFPRVANIARP